MLIEIADPLVNEEQLNIINKLLRENKILISGIKACQKSILNGKKGILIISGDTTPMDLISHLPFLANDYNSKYIFVRSKQDIIGERPCMLIESDEKSEDYKKLYESIENS